MSIASAPTAMVMAIMTVNSRRPMVEGGKGGPS
jgi:hypothetical protein